MISFEECHENHIKMWEAIENTKERIFIQSGRLKEIVADSLFDHKTIEKLAEMSLIKIKFLARLCLFILFILAVIHVTQRNR